MRTQNSATRRSVSKFLNSIKIRSRQIQVAQTIIIKRGEERIFIFILLDKQEGSLCVLATSAFLQHSLWYGKWKLWPNNILWHESVRINNIRLGRILTTDINLHQRSERDERREIKFMKNRQIFCFRVKFRNFKLFT